MWFLCFCFFWVDVKKKKKVCWQRPSILFCFFDRGKLLTEKMKQTTANNRAVSLCVTGSSFRILLKFSSLQGFFFCALLPTAISRVPRAVGYLVLGLFLRVEFEGGEGVRHHVHPSLSRLIWKRLLSFSWTARPPRSQRIDSAVSSWQGTSCFHLLFV